MTNYDERDRRKSAKSTASNASMLKRWKSFVKPFAVQESCDHCGRGSCDNGFEGRWENGVPSVRPRAASKKGQERWPRAPSRVPADSLRAQHARFASSQAISSADGFRMTYDMEADGSDDDPASSRRPSASRGSQAQSFQATVDGDGDRNDFDDDTMGLAQQRRSKRYSNLKSPLSPTFSFGSGDRNADERPTKSTLKRESIRLYALPALPKTEGSRRSFPAGSGMASMLSSPQKSPGLDTGFTFPGPPGPFAAQNCSSTSRVVRWNGLLDPERPLNRPVSIKLMSTILLLGFTLTVTFASSALTPARFQISQELDTTPEIITLASALTVLGFALGAPIFGAVSEEYGRKTPLLLGLTIFVLFSIPISITKNIPTLLAFRIFVGVFGAAPLVIVPGILADLWSPVGRGIALSLFAAVSIIGPVVGAISGSYLAVVDYPGWRWTAWIVILLGVIFGPIFALVFAESSASVLLQRRAKKLRLVTKEWAFHTEAEESDTGLKSRMFQTARMLVEPSLLLPTIHMSFACGVLNLMFVSYGYAFRTERQWLSGTQDLPLAPLIAGCFIGVFINFIVSIKKYTVFVRRDGSAPPEARIIPWIIGSWILPVGLLVFAWTSSPDITFVPQLMAGVPTGIGISLILIGGLNYAVDSYIATPTLAIAATTFVRSALAFAFPLFAPRMYEGLGVAWANTTLAIVAAVLIPIPIVMMKLGPRFRRMSSFAIKPEHVKNETPRGWRAEMAEREEGLTMTMEKGADKMSA